MTNVEPVPGKGLGVLAERNFSPGEEIITEAVSLLCSRGAEARGLTAEQARQIYQNYNRLSTVDKFRVKSLYCMGERSILNIFSTNSFTITSKFGGLFVRISRINHACDPNACYNNCGSLEKVVTALREIKKGEEITISYIINNWDVRSERRSALSCWGFLCSCAVCVLTCFHLACFGRHGRTLLLWFLISLGAWLVTFAVWRLFQSGMPTVQLYRSGNFLLWAMAGLGPI